VLLLTGTPIGKNYLDLYSQLKAIDPNIWKAGWAKTGKMSWTDFKNQYAIWGGRTGYELKGYRNLDDLRSRYRPHIKTARKEDIHDMPKVTDTIVPVEMNATARRVYDLFAEDGVVVHKRHLIEAPIPLTKLLRLQQMTGGWVNDEHGEQVEIQRDKLAILTDLLEDLASAGQSVVIFARFLAEMDAIYDSMVRVYKDNSYQIRGGVTAHLRREAIRNFRRAGSAMVIQIAAAEALDGLQDNCSYGIFYSTDYSLIHWNQARGRLDRVGQSSPVTFYHLQARGTVDGLILEALRDKKDIERMVMDNPEVLLRHM
jgi:SNF2 family DNA or RNA helicase